MDRIRCRLTYANVAATIAVFVALGGSATAAVLITGKNVKDGSLSGQDIKNNSVASVDVKDGDLLGKDFKAGQLPAGAQGPKGDQGLKGDKGDPGLTGDKGAKGDKGDRGPAGDGGTVRTVAGVEFAAGTSAVGVAGGGTCARLTGGSPATLYAPVDLPVGAVVTAVDWYFIDGTAGTVTGSLHLNNLDSASVDGYPTVASEGSNGLLQTVTWTPASPADPITDNQRVVLHAAFDEASVDLQVCGARVHFTPPSV